MDKNFKIGQKFKVVGSSHIIHYLKIFSICELVEIVDETTFRCYGVDEDGYIRSQVISPKDLEPID